MSDPVYLEVAPEQANVKRAAAALRKRRHLFVKGRDGTVLFVVVTPAYFAELTAREPPAAAEG